LHADYVLREFSPDAMIRAIEDDHMTVLEQGGGLAGYCRARHGQDAPIADCHGTELATLYIRPAMQRHGIGRALLSNLKAIAQAQSSPALWLCVNCKNLRAQAFYTAHGFDVVGKTDFVLGENRYPNYLLRCDLSPVG
jgi:diamine N-acetyltransferase